MSLRAVVVLLFVLPLLVGCAHAVELRSEPPGAEVFIEGERVGVTPMILEETSGETDRITVEMRQNGVAARFAIERDGWSAAPVLVGAGLFVVGVVGAPVAMAGGYLFALSAVFTGALLSPALGIAVVTGGLALYALGVVGLSLATWAPFVGAGLFSRVSPDQIAVDFQTGEIAMTPAGHIEPLVGVPAGYRPLRRREEEE